MTLIPILISYFAMRESWIPDVIRERRWAGAYLRLFEQTGIAAKVHPALVYGVFVLVPMFFAWYLAVIAHGWLFVVLDFVLAFFLLCSSIGSRRLNTNFQPFLKRWRHQEWQAAYEYGAQLFDYSKTISNADLLSQTITHYLIRMNQCLFAPVLWFVVFGTAAVQHATLEQAQEQAALLQKARQEQDLQDQQQAELEFVLQYSSQLKQQQAPR